MSKELYSIPEAAELKSCSRTAILYAIRDGRIAAERVGRNWVIRAEDLRGYRPRIYGGIRARRVARAS